MLRLTANTGTPGGKPKPYSLLGKKLWVDGKQGYICNVWWGSKAPKWVVAAPGLTEAYWWSELKHVL